MRYRQEPVGNVVASYRVYGNGADVQDEDGFIPASNAYQKVIRDPPDDNKVSKSSNGVQARTTDSPSCGWCLSSSATTPGRDSCLFSWCRPTLLLLILILLIIIFVFISGVLLYYNCTSDT